MTAFDAELYLRMLGERRMVDAELADVDHPAMELDDAAAALVVGGVIDERRAADICREYALATELVSRPALAERMSHLRERSSEPAPPDLEPRQVFAPGAELSLAAGALSIRSVTVSETRTAIDGTLVMASGTATAHGLTISAGGRSAVTHFSGGLHGVTCTGLWECESTFPAGTEWLEIDGCRLELSRCQQAPSFTLRTFSAEQRLERFLWLLVSGWGHDFGENALGTALTALREAGLMLESERPGLPVRRWSRTSRYGSPEPDVHRISEPFPAVYSPVPAPAGWLAGVISPPRPGGAPAGVVAVGAVSPRFDGVMVAIDSLTVDEHGLAAEVEVSGASSPHPRLGRRELGIKPISWWISDEHGNRYVGELGRASSTAAQTRGTVTFGDVKGQPTLLTISVATPSAMATIAIPLEWR